MNTNSNPARVPARSQAKAILGGVLAALSFAIPVVDDGILLSEALGIALAGLTAYGIVFGVRNR